MKKKHFPHLKMESAVNGLSLIHILDYYNQLNDFGKKEATKYLEELTHFSKYTDNNFANEENF